MAKEAGAATDQRAGVRERQGWDARLTKRAGLTFASNITDQGVAVVAYLVLSRVVVRALGAETYGAWVMIQQTIGYLAQADLRPTATLKLLIARLQPSAEIGEKRRHVGAAIRLWSWTAPVIVLAAVVLGAFSPLYIRTDHLAAFAIQSAMVVAVLGFGADRLLQIPANILRGENLDYLAFGVTSVGVLVGTGLSVWAITHGGGLIDLVAGLLLGTLLAGLLRMIVTRRNVSWYGLEKPSSSEMRDFLGKSGWLVASAMLVLAIESGDVLLTGVLLGPKAAGMYAATTFLMRTIAGFGRKLIGASGAAVGGLLGSGGDARVGSIGDELRIIMLMFGTVIVTVAVVVNRSFVGVWLGPSLYAGLTTSLAIGVAVAAMLLARIELLIVEAGLGFPRVVVNAAISLLVGASVAVVTRGPMGMAGVALAAIVTRTLFALLLHRSAGVVSRRWPSSVLVRDVLSVLAGIGVGVGVMMVFSERGSLGMLGTAALLLAAVVASTSGFLFVIGPLTRARLLRRARGLVPRWSTGTSR